jgi:hypothetical protein
VDDDHRRGDDRLLPGHPLRHDHHDFHPRHELDARPDPRCRDIGATGRGWARRLAVAAGNTAPGWTLATADDFVGSSIAFKETPMVQQSGGSRQPYLAYRRAVVRAATW